MGKNKQKKIPLFPPPKGAKHAPTPSVPGGYKPKKPTWRLGRIDLEGPWGWGAIERDELLVVLKRLKEFEKLRWQDIIGPTPKSHPIETDRLAKEARDRLVELKLDDLDELMSLRVQGDMRVWGYLERAGEFVGVCDLLWFDRKHTVYPVELKNT